MAEPRPRSDGSQEVIAGLVEDMAVLKQSIMDERWQAVAANFAQINDNLIGLHKRIEQLERLAHERDRGNGSG